MKKIKLLGLVLLVLVISGCENTREIKLKAFKDGKDLYCSQWTSSNVITNVEWKYSESLNVYYKDSITYRSGDCSPDEVK